MTEIMCIDGKFPAEQLEYYAKTGVTVPLQDQIYTIRDIIFNAVNGKGLRLQEIVNPTIPIQHPILGLVQLEPNWAIRRFTTLLGESITDDMLREWQKEMKDTVLHNEDLISDSN